MVYPAKGSMGVVSGVFTRGDDGQVKHSPWEGSKDHKDYEKAQGRLSKSARSSSRDSRPSAGIRTDVVNITANPDSQSAPKISSRTLSPGPKNRSSAGRIPENRKTEDSSERKEFRDFLTQSFKEYLDRVMEVVEEACGSEVSVLLKDRADDLRRVAKDSWPSVKKFLHHVSESDAVEFHRPDLDSARVAFDNIDDFMLYYFNCIAENVADDFPEAAIEDYPTKAELLARIHLATHWDDKRTPDKYKNLQPDKLQVTNSALWLRFMKCIEETLTEKLANERESRSQTEQEICTIFENSEDPESKEVTFEGLKNIDLENSAITVAHMYQAAEAVLKALEKQNKHITIFENNETIFENNEESQPNAVKGSDARAGLRQRAAHAAETSEQGYDTSLQDCDLFVDFVTLTKQSLDFIKSLSPSIEKRTVASLARKAERYGLQNSKVENIPLTIHDMLIVFDELDKSEKDSIVEVDRLSVSSSLIVQIG